MLAHGLELRIQRLLAREQCNPSAESENMALFMDGGTRWFPPSSSLSPAEQHTKFLQNQAWHIWIERSRHEEHESNICLV